MMSSSGFWFHWNSTMLGSKLKFTPTSKPVTVIGRARLTGSTAARESPAMPRSSNAWAVTV